jgi:nucleotide-binding universal stress UspA family protein
MTTPGTFSRILVPTDFSAGSEEAWRAAQRVAAAVGAGPGVFEGPLTGDAIGEFSTAGREWATMLERWADEGRAAGCKVHTALRVGVPYREIVAAAKDEAADLVLLATHGRGKIHRLLVGSVADRVIRMAPCPVLTLREEKQAA